jgi:hypothetical protein
VWLLLLLLAWDFPLHDMTDPSQLDEARLREGYNRQTFGQLLVTLSVTVIAGVCVCVTITQSL